MADKRIFNGGRREGAGRKTKLIEDARQSVIFELFDDAAERLVVAGQIQLAASGVRGSTAAAQWLFDRKYGKLKESVEQSGETVIRVEYVEPDD